MNRMLITLLAVCLLLISVGKSYANADISLPHLGDNVVSTHGCHLDMTEACDTMHNSCAGFFSHFHCHLSMTSLITHYSSIRLMGLSAPNYHYHFSSKVYIQALSAKPPQFI